MSDGMRCPGCERTHTDWADAGSYTVDDGHHAGIIERFRCEQCDEIVEGGRR